MATKRKRIASIAVATVMSVGAASGLIALTGCGDPEVPPVTNKHGTYRTYTSVMPSDWNEFTYLDNNDTQIMNYLSSSFFSFDFRFDGNKFNADGTVNANAIVDGEFSTEFSAATALKDVTTTVDAKWGYTQAQKDMGGYAWEITLREDLKWDDGTAIKAGDFVYSMQEQLNPDFMHVRASTYYNQIRIHNSKQYLYSKSDVTYMSIKSQDSEVTTVDAAVTKYGRDKIYIDIFDMWNAQGYTDENGALAPQYVVSNDTTLYDTPRYWEWENRERYEELLEKDDAGTITEDEEKELATLATENPSDAFNANWLYGYYENYGMLTLSNLYISVENKDKGTSFENVGIYAPSDYKLVICLDSPIQMLKEDGSLSYLAPYMLSSLPLVKKDLYESCKKEPVAGSTLYTTNYNSSKETTASWGPYKLEAFQGGKSYKLVRNDNWFGYPLDQYKGQYNVTAIECEKITELTTQWLNFFGGKLDSIPVDVTHKDDYRNSKYTHFNAGSGVFGTNIYANKEVLKRNGRNNGILAIDDFRKAISLAINRDAYNSSLSTSNKTCLGLITLTSLYDVDNGLSYSNTKESREALLRVYGFSQNSDGTWTDGSKQYPDYEEAFEAMTGYDIVQARALVEKAYTELTAHADDYGYDPDKKITIKFGTSADTAGSRRYYNYYVQLFKDLTAGTSLENKIEVVFDASFGKGWSTAFRSGEYDLAPATGFTGSALDPYNFIGVYIDPNAGLMYSTWWDTEEEELTITLPQADNCEGAGQTLTMSIVNWYYCLNGTADSYDVPQKYNWGAGFAPSNVRLAILAKLEETILGKYYTIQTTSEYSAEMLGAKFSYICDADNFFVGFGGIRYMLVNYTDTEWEEFVASKNNSLAEFYKAES